MWIYLERILSTRVGRLGLVVIYLVLAGTELWGSHKLINTAPELLSHIKTLQSHGVTPFDCDRGNRTAIGRTKGESIVSDDRLYFELTREQGDTQATECLADCQKFMPDAGRCLVGDKAAAVHQGMYCLPSFLIVGAMKAGTGELMKALNRHPMLQSGHGSAGQNEIHFFGSEREAAERRRVSLTKTNAADAHGPEFECPWVRYSKHFRNTYNEPHIYGFDKSPDILRTEVAQHQMKDMLPSAKLIVLLRNPTTRAVSAFEHNCRHGRYARVKDDICLTQDVKTIKYEAGSMVRVDWLVDAASNVLFGESKIQEESPMNISGRGTSVRGRNNHEMVGSLDKTGIFGASHSYSDFSKPACLHICGAGAMPDAAAKAKHTMSADAMPACEDVQFETVMEHLSVASNPCSPHDVRDYFFPWKSEDSVDKDQKSRETEAETGVNARAGTRDGSTASAVSHGEVELGHGFYDIQLHNLLQKYPARQIMLLYQEQMLAATNQTLIEVQNFLGVPVVDLTEKPSRFFRVISWFSAKKSTRKKLQASIPKSLTDLFNDVYWKHNLLLESLIKKNAHMRVFSQQIWSWNKLPESWSLLPERKNNEMD